MASDQEDLDNLFEGEEEEVPENLTAFNYDVVKLGERLTTKVYLHRGFGYSSDRYRNGKQYLKCYFKRHGSCKGRAVVCGGFLEETHDHTCNPDTTFWEVRQARNEMKEKAGAVPDDFAKIHRETLNNYGMEVASQIPYQRVKSTLKKARKKRYVYTF
jgi:hypothetical protein